MQPGAPQPPQYPYPYPYPPPKPPRSAAVTVVIVLACVFGGIMVLGIIAAIAIPSFLKYEQKSKKSEAQLSLDLIKKAEKAQWPESTGFVVGSAGPTPAEPCCDSPGNKCAPDPATFMEDPIWSELDFEMNTSFYCQYTYDGTQDHFIAHALCDLDCDGEVADYKLEGTRDASGGPQFVETDAPPGAD